MPPTKKQESAEQLTVWGLPAQIWAKDRARWGKLWPEEPWIESLVVCGVAEVAAILAKLHGTVLELSNLSQAALGPANGYRAVVHLLGSGGYQAL